MRYIALIFSVIFFVLLLIYIDKKYYTFVLIQIFFLSIAIVEPSPSDFLFLLLFVFYIKKIDQDIEVLTKNAFVITIFLYLITNIISIYYVEEYFDSIKYLSITIYLILYSLFIYVYLLHKDYKGITRAYIYSSTFSVVVGIFGYLNFLPNILRYDSYRVKGFFKDPNVFGPFIVPAIIILIHNMFNKKYIHNIYLHIALIVLNTIGVLISFSRGAWINLSFTVLIYFVLNIRKINIFKVFKYIFVSLIIFSIIWLVFINTEFKDFIFERAKIQSYDNYRFLAQKTGLKLVFNRLFGYGPGQYENAIIYFINMDISAHSMYMRILLENGVLGFLLIVVSFFYIIINLLLIHIKKFNTNDLDSSVVIALLIGIFINSIVIDTLHWRHLWLFIGIGLSIIGKYKEDNERDYYEYKNY